MNCTRPAHNDYELNHINLHYWQDGFDALFTKWETQQAIIRDLREALAKYNTDAALLERALAVYVS